jgi:hypothetical protein
MAVAIIIIVILLSGAATELYLSTFTCPAARQPQKRCSMVFCSFKEKFAEQGQS